MQLLGVLLIVISIIVTYWLIIKGHSKGIIVICALAVLAGFGLILKDEITEITINNVGTIKAATKQAVHDAEEIASIKERIEGQSATVDLVAKQASEAKELIDNLTTQNEIAEDRLNKIGKKLEEANSTVAELKLLLEFTATVQAAQSDDRRAFDKLWDWGNDKNYPFSKNAERAHMAILESHSRLIVMAWPTLVWNENVDPSTLNYNVLKNAYKEIHIDMRQPFIKYLYDRKDISRIEKVEFLINVIKNDSSLKAVEYAGRVLLDLENLRFKALEIGKFIKWWEENRKTIE